MGGRQFVYETLLMFPDWSLVLVLLVLPAWRGLAWRKARRGGRRGFEIRPPNPSA
jgi:hypothetical protein